LTATGSPWAKLRQRSYHACARTRTLQLEGSHVERGYMWPYVLPAFLTSPLIAGLLFDPGA